MLTGRDPGVGTGAAARRRAAAAALVRDEDHAWEPRLTLTAVPVARLDVARGRRRSWTWVGVVARAALAVSVAGIVLVVLRRPDGLLDDSIEDSVLADRLVTLAGWAMNVSATLVLGGLAYRGFVRDGSAPTDGHAERVLCTVAIAGGVAAMVTLPLRATALSGAWQTTLRDPSTLTFVMSSPFGDSVLLRTAGLLLVAAAVGRAVRLGRSGIGEALGCGAGAGAILASYCLVGHPQATGGRPSVLVLSQLGHIVAVAVWFGGVTFLALDLRRRRAGDPRGAAAVVRRFSTLATAAVVAAAGTGLVLAYSQIGSVRALWATAYGRAFLAKLSCVALVLAVGGYNREFLVPALARHRDRDVWHRLRRTLTVEMLVIGMGVLLATAVMTSGGW